MNFSTLFQTNTKRLWWVDVIFYFVISLFIATALCYLIFLLKNSLQREEIKTQTEALLSVGTDQEKGYEREVVSYKEKIADFAGLFENHEFASNVFAFMQAQTMPNIWFKQFSLDKKSNTVQLAGESDDMDSFSRQVSHLEKNEYVKSLSNLSSSIGDSARIQFNLSMVLDDAIFGYISKAEEQLPAENQNPVVQPSQPAGPAQQNTQEPAPEQQQKSSEKAINSFKLLLNPEVMATIDHNNGTISLSVPFGTNITKVSAFAEIPPKSSILPLLSMPQDFSTPIMYRVTAEDGTTKDYKVTVTVMPEPVNKSGTLILAVWIVAVMAIILSSVVFALLKMRKNHAS